MNACAKLEQENLPPYYYENIDPYVGIMIPSQERESRKGIRETGGQK